MRFKYVFLVSLVACRYYFTVLIHAFFCCGGFVCCSVGSLCIGFIFDGLLLFGFLVVDNIFCG